MPNFGYYGLDYEPQQNVNYKDGNFDAASVTLGEIGLSYAYSFRKIYMEEWNAGITFKKYFPIAATYMHARDVDYIVLNDTSINVKNLDAEIGYSLPMDYSNNDFPDDGPIIKGGGFGFDLGITYRNNRLSYQKKRITKLCRQKYIDYHYRVGISILDIGYVNMKKNTQLHSFDNVSEYWINVDTLTYSNLNQLSRSISNVFYDDPNASLVDDKITVLLPTAFSLQVDYRIAENFYAGGVFIHPLRLGKSYIRRPVQIVLVPRYETPHVEVSVPLSLYDYKYPRVGISARYRFLSIGTDDLLGFLGITNFTGIDIYISIKLNYRKGYCGKYKRDVPCENHEYGVRMRRK
jgi:hypothetical protein